MTPTPSPWFPFYKPVAQARLRLFCFPFAGGGAAVFSGWASGMPPGVEIVAVQPPGRERRILEKPFQDVEPLLDSLEPAMAPLLDLPCAFFGYSMGTRIALALAQRWQARGSRPLPVGLVLGASNAPHLPRPHRADLPEADFIQLLRRYEGTPAQVFEHKELMDMVLPTLRADFAIADGLRSSVPVRAPFSVYGGLEDPHASLEELERWHELTTQSFQVRHFPGKHFFLRTAQDAVLAAVREDLLRWAPFLGA